jgi:hypothetical protein
MNGAFFCPFKLVLIAAILNLSFESNAAGLDEMTGNDVTLSEYRGLLLIAQVHTTRIFTDYERRGFFRIGLLPIPVAENVQIQIESAECLTNALFALHDWEQLSVGVRRLELRNLQITMFGEKQPRLCATAARIGKNGSIELSNISLTGFEGQKIFIARGILQIAGNDAGRLSWNTDGSTHELYPLNLKTKTP